MANKTVVIPMSKVIEGQKKMPLLRELMGRYNKVNNLKLDYIDACGLFSFIQRPRIQEKAIKAYNELMECVNKYQNIVNPEFTNNIVSMAQSAMAHMNIARFT